MSRPPVDPDLVQAVANLSEVAERYRGAMRQVVTAARDHDDKLYYASERVAEDARQMIQLRAEKLGWKPDALMAVLLMAATLDPQLRRKPNLLDIERGLERDARAQADRAADLRARAVAAERRAALAEKDALAAKAGLQLFGVYL